MLHVEVNGSFEKDLLHVTFAITGSVRLVHGLGNKGSGARKR